MKKPEKQLQDLETEDLPVFKHDMMEAFEGIKEVLTEFEGDDEPILPESDIDACLEQPESKAWKIVVDGQMVGGAIVHTCRQDNAAHLDFLYVKTGFQNLHLGKCMWQQIEAAYPEVEVWQTVTPVFEKRNLHFYTKTCGFTIVSPMPDPQGPEEEEMILLEKRMSRK